MKITIDSSLEETPLRDMKPGILVSGVLRSFDKDRQFRALSDGSQLSGRPQDSFLYMVRDCYSAHHAVKVNPHDLWYVVLCEIATTMNANSDAFRDIFTTSSEKTEIIVETSDSTHLPLDAIINQLRHHVPGDVELFIPEFTTHTRGSRLACYAAFADAVKSYYSYGTLLCGLPAVEFGGTKADWELFGSNLTHIALMLKPIIDGLSQPGHDGWGRGDAANVSSAYFHRVISRVEQVCELFDGGSEQFVRDFYSHRNVGSGSQKDVSGWIADFYVNTTKSLDNFNPCLSVVPYKNHDSGREFTLVYGAFSSTVEDGFRTAQYDGLVFEKVGAEVVSVQQEIDYASRGVVIRRTEGSPLVGIGPGSKEEIDAVWDRLKRTTTPEVASKLTLPLKMPVTFVSRPED